MNIRATLILGIFLLWGGGSWWYYTCKIKKTCYDNQQIIETQLVEEAITGIKFKPYSAEPITGEDLPIFKQNLLAAKMDESKFQITGKYYNWEADSFPGVDLGMERAKKVKALFAGDLLETDFELKSQLVNDGTIPGNQNLDICELGWIQYQIPIDSILEAANTVEVEKEEIFIVENKNGITIYFPSKSTQEIGTAQVNAALSKLAKKMKIEGQPASIVGHTDNVGDEKTNYDLALSRANTIMKMLIKNGIPARQVAAYSIGENQPAATNETEEGRQKNRRVEIVF